jgi:hypothetical protein
MYANVCMHTNYSCDITSDQLTVTVERDFVRNCYRKLMVMRFSWTQCVFLMKQHSVWMVLWTDKTAELGVINNFRNYWTSEAHAKGCVMWHDERSYHGPFLFQKAIVTSHSYLNILEHYTVTQLPCDAWFQQDGAPPTFWKHCKFLNQCFPNKQTGRGS